MSAARLPEPANAPAMRSTPGRSTSAPVPAERPRRGPCRRARTGSTRSISRRPAGWPAPRRSRATDSSAGMIPSSRGDAPERRQRLVVGDRHVARAAGCRAAARARGRRPGSRGRPRSSAPRGSGPSSSCRIAESAPCSTPGAPAGGQRRAVAAGLERPRRRPRRRRARRSASSTKGANMPIALEPPPTQATTRSGSRPSRSRICARASSPITRWRSRTIAGYGAGPTAEPMM